MGQPELPVLTVLLALLARPAQLVPVGVLQAPLALPVQLVLPEQGAALQVLRAQQDWPVLPGRRVIPVQMELQAQQGLRELMELQEPMA